MTELFNFLTNFDLRLTTTIRHIIEHFDKLSVTEHARILTAYDLSLTTTIRHILEYFDGAVNDTFNIYGINFYQLTH